jgi:hypothetical protein
MSTAQSIIDRSLRLISAIASGESPTAQESADALVALNNMIESWQTERLIVYAFVDTPFTLVNGDNSYTIGPTGNFVITPRPSILENVFVRASDIDYPVQMVTKDEWYAIVDKTSESDIPMFGYYEPTMTNGTLLLWPVPNTAYSLHIVTWQPVTSFAALSTAVSLPQGYERALAYNLALEIAPEFEKQPAPSVERIAMESLAMIKRANNINRPIKAYTELVGILNTQRSNIFSGGYVA